MRKYEMLTIFQPQLSEEDLGNALESVRRAITTLEGEVLEAHRDAPWGRRRLAYPIRHNSQDLRDGFYVLFYFNLESRKVGQMERAMHLNDQVIRHMIIRYEEPKIKERKPKAAAVAAAAAAAAAAPASE